MIRRPPRSTRTDTLFPYTTLFRSQAIESGRRIGLAHPVAVAIEQDIDSSHVELKRLCHRFGDAGDLGIEGEWQCRAAERDVRLESAIFRASLHGGDSLPHYHQHAQIGRAHV